ncbi:hypothetical protein [Taibaiella koreensis]|uniref:hypothetical protein n=1 Tax=Taibaiella koreensis TaxID=1268548 RepID=UPI000E59BD92|nr:hypothetical protein [Taibaiella koreensis]
MNRSILHCSGLIPVLLLLFLSSCGNKSMDLARELSSSYTHDGKTITAEGRLATDLMIWGTGQTLDMNLEMQAALDNSKRERITDIVLPYGTGKNSVKIDVPDTARHFEAKDVLIYDKNGEKITTSDKVRITGTVTYTAKGPKKKSNDHVMITVPKPRKEEGDGNDYSYKISNVTIEKL